MQLSKLDHYYILNNFNLVLKDPSIIEGVVFIISYEVIKVGNHVTTLLCALFLKNLH